MTSTLSAWILSIAGVVLLSVLVELILPAGSMSKYIKGIFAFIIMFVILSPVPKLLNQNIDISNWFDSQTIKVDEDYLQHLNYDKMIKLQSDIESEISSYGYNNVKIYISSDIFDNTFSVKSVTVDLTKLVITENAEHTNIVKIKQHITEIIKSRIKVGEDEIFYE